MGSLPMLVMFVVILGMWFFMSRSQKKQQQERQSLLDSCLLYTSPSPRDGLLSRMPSSA